MFKPYLLQPLSISICSQRRAPYMGLLKSEVLRKLGRVLLLCTALSALSVHAAVGVAPSGAYQTDIAIEVPSYHGIQPRLRLVYDSSVGNGLAGVGWRLSGLSEVQRVSLGKGAARMDATDIYLLDGMELVRCQPGMRSPSCAYPADGSNFAAYAFRTDTFQRVAFESNRAGGRWHVWNKNGTRSIYNPSTLRRGAGNSQWLLSTVQDTSGNTVQYNYVPYDAGDGFAAEWYLNSISYNGITIQCYYEQRADLRTYANNGGQTLQKRRLKSIDVTVGTARARAYALEYDPTSSPLAGMHSRLIAVKQYGTDAVVDAAGAVSGSNMPIVSMTYAPAPPGAWAPSLINAGQQPSGVGARPTSLYANTGVPMVRVGGGKYGPIVAGDYNGDGRTDWLAVGFTGQGQKDITIKSVVTGTPSPLMTDSVQKFTPDNAWVGWDRLTIYAWSLDLNGDGRSDLLIGIGYHQVAPIDDEQIALMPAISRGDGTFTVGTAVRTDIIRQNFDPNPPACRPGDFDGNGLMDVACLYMPRVNQQLGATESFMSMVLSQRDGTFAISNTKLPFHDNGGIRPFATGDVDRDGRSDLLFLDPRGADLDEIAAGNTNVDIHYDLVTGLSRGGDASTFSYLRQETTWIYLRKSKRNPDLVASDINGDGRTDFLVLPYGGNDEYPLSILTGIAQVDGTLALNEQPVPNNLNMGERVITVGDADGDGMADLLVASKREQGAGSNCVNGSLFADIVLNRVPSKGDGTFALPAAWDDCSIARQVDLEWNRELNPFALHAVDTNGDGLSDFLIAANAPYDNTTAILHDDVSVNAALDTFRWMPAEINGDGRRDYLFVQPQGNQTIVHTLIAQTGGGFVQQRQQLAPDVYGLGRQIMRSWKAMDVDGDGRTDLVYAHCAGLSATQTCLVEVEVFFADGSGMWNQAFPQRFTWPGAHADATVIPADVDGDGKTDLVAIMRQLGSGGGIVIQILNATGAAATPFTSRYVTAFTVGAQQGPFADTGEDSGTWRSADVDGDGKTDLLHLANTGATLKITTLFARENGQWRAASASIPQAMAQLWDNVSPTDTLQWRDADVNGDGKIDLVHFAVTAAGLRIHTLLSGGNGINWTQRWQELPFAGADLPLLADRTAWLTTDLDKDGRTDFVHVHRQQSNLRLDILTSAGDGLFTAETATFADPGSAGNRASPTWQVTDLDGDGRGDLARIDLATPPTGSTTRPLQVSALRSIRSNELLASITNNMGGSTEITYSPAAAYDPSQPSFGCSLPAGATLQVAASATVKDGRGTSETTSFGYGCPKWSHYHRAFLGWKEVNATSDATNNRPKVSHLRRYDQTDACFTQLQDTAYLDAFGKYVGSREIIANDSPGQSAPYRCLTVYRNKLEYGTSTNALNAYTYFNFDQFGNLSSIAELGSSAVNGDEVTTNIYYKYADQPWIVGLPWQQVTTDPARPGSVLRSTFFCYDGNNGTDWANCPGTPTKGLLTAMQRVDDLGLYVTNTYLYDPLGNLAAVQDPLRFGTATFFDSAYRTFPEAVVNALSQTSYLEWDKALGKVKKTTDANGAMTSTQYDAFGRVSIAVAGNNNSTYRQYLDWGNPNSQRVHEYSEDGTSDGLWVDTYFDGLGRIYKVIKEGEAANTTYMQELTYNDASDRVRTRSQWFANGTRTIPLDTFEYDEVGRLVKLTHADATTQRITYDADASSTIRRLRNERGISKAIVSDAYGRVASVTQRDQATAQTATVRYSYSPLGELLTVTDPNGNVTTNTWDMLGKLRKVQSPDLGMRTITYDLAGNLKTRTDARNRTITYTHDPLGRPKTKTYQSGQTVTWNYDEVGYGASKGRLTSVSDLTKGTCAQGHTSEFTYDLLGSVTKQVKCIDGMSYTTGFGHDRLARLDSVTYPDNEVVSYTYNNAGRLKTMPGYVDNIEYNPAGQPTYIDYSNGTDVRFTYHPNRAWLDTARVANSAGGALYDATYTYEANGLVKSTASTTNAMNVTFTYDDLDRLRDASGDITEYFRYDPAGNMTASTNFPTYAYPMPGPQGCMVGTVAQPCPRPNAPTGAGLMALQHDANGNLSMVTNAQNQTKGIDWTDDHQPLVSSDFSGVATTYGYDADGERVSQQRSGTYGRYFSPLVEHSSFTGLTKNYFAGSLLVARKTAGVTRWFHSDQIGSTRLITDAAGAVSQRYDYAPYGEQTATSGAGVANNVKFVGQQNDDSGLIYMRARYYDPQLARFISPDTVIPDAINPQSLNPYSYAYNSPLSYADPTGHQPIGISQQWQSDAGSFSVSITLVSMPPPIAMPAKQPGQICSACYGGTSIYNTSFAIPKAPPTVPDPRIHEQKVTELIGQYRAASESEYEAWDRAREDYRRIHLKGGDSVLRDAEHFLFRFWLASRPTFGEVVWIPRPLPWGKGVGETAEDPSYTAPMNSLFMMNMHDVFYNPLREIILERIKNISPTTPSMYEWERRGYNYGFCAAGDCDRLRQLEHSMELMNPFQFPY